jgi:hypothetical protein
MADKTKADGDDRQAQEPARNRLEHQGGQHQRQARPHRNDERCGCHHGGTQRDRGLLRPHCIEQSTAG